MKRLNMKKLKKDQRGLTLIELIIVIALTGIITAAITMTIMQVFTMNTRASNRMTAVSQVQHAGKLVSEDILEARTVDTESEFLKLTWTEIGEATNYTHTIIYSLEDSELWRSESINGGNSTLTRVAEHIDLAGTYLDWDDVNNVLTFTVTATVGEQSETREYKVKPRPGSY